MVITAVGRIKGSEGFTPWDRDHGGLKVGFGHVSAHHAMAIKVVGYLADGVLHQSDPFIASLVEHGEDDVLKLIVQIIDFPGCHLFR